MKKIFLLISLMFLLTGCTNLKDQRYDDVIKNFATSVSSANTFRTGYKYYLPRGMKVIDSKLYNEVISDERYNYYLYVDVVSYYNKVKKSYPKNNKSVYSETISFKNNFGYIEINLVENEQYLVEIMYNYAKIEVIVDKDSCNRAIVSAISILKSVVYNDSIITNLLGDDILNFYEEEFDIFNTKGKDNNYIDDNYQVGSDRDQLPDMDLIN